MRTSRKVMAGVGGLVLAVAATFGGVAIANPGAPAEDAPVKTVQEQPRVTPTATVAPAPVVAPVEVSPPVEVPPPTSLTKCPADTKANSVDDAGNESNCEPLGPSGQPCVAYNDQNECTAYLKP